MTRYSIYMPKALFERVCFILKETELGRSYLIRQAVEKYLHGKNKQEILSELRKSKGVKKE